MASTNKHPPDQTATLAEFVSAGINDDMTYRNFAIVEVIPCGLELIDHNIIDDYLDELKRISIQITNITDAERVRYKYAPDLLAYDVYGSTQLDFIIMAINGVATPTEFTMKGILRLPTASNLKTFLSSVYNANAEYINLNRSNNGLKK